MKRTYRNSQKAGNFPIKEVNTLPSLTVPDQAMSIEEILRRFASGTMPDILRENVFTEDLPDLRGLDISEIHAMRAEAEQDVEYYKNELQAREREIYLSKFSRKTETLVQPENQQQWTQQQSQPSQEAPKQA